MKGIIITGAKGLIGSVLRKGLTDFKITLLDLPKQDVRDYDKLLKFLPGHDAIIHLAWDTNIDNVNTNKINPDNSLMFWNVYKGALESGVKRVIMASSVHAETYYGWKGPGLISPEKIPMPDTPYGAHKVFMESLGRYYSQQGLEVICIRFGGVIPNNKPSPGGNPYERAAWLSHGDCAELIRKCLITKKVPDNFVIVYGVSNNKKRIHDIFNPFGWVPKDKIEKNEDNSFYKT